ncbi:uncharacterized protein [Triticum aestivum]|uniref:uncharacterized protein isoform X2 n=1 Tax=Triticum aestivum TaxID=4565 RepID=UPI001D01AA7E|nr:uncharacterized protein LOC123071498 isoform X2 [Triticum aestivum]
MPYILWFGIYRMPSLVMYPLWLLHPSLRTFSPPQRSEVTHAVGNCCSEKNMFWKQEPLPHKMGYDYAVGDMRKGDQRVHEEFLLSTRAGCPQEECRPRCIARAIRSNVAESSRN